MTQAATAIGGGVPTQNDVVPDAGPVPTPSLPRRLFTATAARTKRFRTWAARGPAGFPNAWLLYPTILLLTALGGFLRFWRIDHQGYWHDEAKTIARICGSLHDLLSTLENQGFPPGWYILLRGWTLFVHAYTGSDVAPFTPAWIRALPALLGTLMVPAMYFLARQFTDRKGALLVALLVAVNPFLIYYSRDIKMYMACWLFLVVHIALFFQWQTTHRHWLWWPLFVLAGVAAVAMHASAWFIIGLELLWLLTRPRLKSLDGALWVLAIGVMAIIPVYWYMYGSNWVSRTMEGDKDAGLEWIRDYTNMSWTTVVSLPCSHLLGYLWPEWPISQRSVFWFGLGPTFKAHLDTHTTGTVLDLAQYPGGSLLRWVGIPTAYTLPDLQAIVATVVLAVMFLGLLPWRGLRATYERSTSSTRGRTWWIAMWILVPMAFLAATWIPADSPWFPRVWGWLGKKQMQALWEPRYLGIVAPAFILWLAAALRRLPTWPLRTGVILFVLTACTISSLSNHLIYRQPPWQRPAATMMKYYDPARPEQIAIGLPWTRFPGGAEIDHTNLARGVHPFPEGSWDPFYNSPHIRRKLKLSDEVLPYDSALEAIPYTLFLDQSRADPTIKTIVMTDRYGELNGAKDELSDAAIAGRLGGRWRLVETDTYRWYYEWRFYYYHTWRTRVWVRAAPSPARPVPPGN